MWIILIVKHYYLTLFIIVRLAICHMYYVKMKLAEEIESLGPFGKGNESPLFAEKGMEILGYRIYGQNKNVMKLKLKGQRGSVHEVIYFRPDDFEKDLSNWFSEEEMEKMKKGIATGRKMDIAYEVGINDFNNSRTVQLVLKAYDV